MDLAQGGLQVVARQHHSQVVARHHSKDAPVRTTVSLIRETSRSWADSLPIACFAQRTREQLFDRQLFQHIEIGRFFEELKHCLSRPVAGEFVLT